MRTSKVNLPHSGPILTGKLIRRYKRFFVDVHLDGQPPGSMVTAHTPNTGSMRGLTAPGSAVLLTHDPAPHRKLHYTLQAVKVGRSWVGCNTGVPNRIMERAFSQAAIRGFSAYRTVQREVKVGAEGRSRLDLLLSDHTRGDPECYVEIKNVTLKEGKLARFPDAKTERGRKHLHELIKLKKAGKRAAMAFVVQRMDCETFEPASDIDPAYGQALKEAADAGVEIRAFRAHVTRGGVALAGELKIRL
jgi:sugar fermentation stimulation protein A